ncbi:unnamed protein product [Mytilus edulis]|uniref:Uncharacterized protein n=1 Tax=Mytilus edulis TaxID=6550 RepID=A0A8S3Q780_MYTED|nr:unnamed protein product [Mytilus edulis]
MPHNDKICLSLKTDFSQEQMPHAQQDLYPSELLISQEQMPHVQQDLYPSKRTTDISQEQMPITDAMYSKICICQELLISPQEQMPCTARSAYPFKTTDFLTEQMPHNRCHVLTGSVSLELLISHKNRCHMYESRICILQELLQYLSRTDTDIKQRTDTCTARSAYPSRATDTSQEQITCTARQTDTSQEQTCTARSASRTTSQEQIMYSKICLSFKSY